ncbi:MAG: 7-cyano-7-deazaguanine synthase QueC [Nanoarchaeota archaeon]|nr:7-cyano-7-deazaguanine synthase QueC [Nanoarchaeota archaeon]
MKNAIVLCSGGLDSVVTAHHMKKNLGYERVIILFFNYGQRAVKQERKAAKKCCSDLNTEFMEIKIDEIKKISRSLINIKSRVQRVRRKELKDTKKESDKWYVPCRNIIFLSYALALAESLYLKDKNIFDIAVGFKNEGEEGFPDASGEFVKEFNKINRIACKKPFRIIAPLIKKDKEDIVLLGDDLKVRLEETFSCYSGEGGGKHCGYCLACRLRQEGFYWANISDLTKYQVRMPDSKKP